MVLNKPPDECRVELVLLHFKIQGQRVLYNSLVLATTLWLVPVVDNSS
jgi:hypothetical protein